ncbi:hypothetical protein [Stenotrophomonas maltophilia]|uniref:hypothetical protein n=1 Tax=Stenotrophomonas maltophilia TaxID=40324 RepID=UPI000C263283|nr:hypothetical protein [Stenotrophomonas maltophilia]PJL60654.1 hypothetical protein B9Y82_18730 [Stenotrophomonas maltophilia]
MTTDKKTLADVQPGGMVRLGDGWTGWATQYPNKMPKLCGAREIAELNHYPEEGQRLIFLTENPVQVGDLVDAARAALPFVAFAYSKGVAGAEEAGRAIESALSAQPSPGGQDVLFIIEELAELRRLVPSVNQKQALDAAIAALAARQPVGEPVAWYYGFSDTGEAGPVTFGGNPGAEAIAWAERHGHTLHYLYAAPPAQAVELARAKVKIAALELQLATYEAPAQAVDYQAALLAEERSHSETIDQRDRCEEVADELAARIAAITGVDIGEHSSANCPWQNAIEAAEEYKPAQAVDLGDFKALYRAYVRLLESGRDRIRDLGGTCDPVDVMEANDVDLQAARRVLDSQAVGNG